MSAYPRVGNTCPPLTGSLALGSTDGDGTHSGANEDSLDLPKVDARELARVTYPGKTEPTRRVPIQPSFHVVIACIPSEPHVSLDWELMGAGLGGGMISCNGKEAFLESAAPLTGGQIGIRFKNKPDKVTRAYAIRRSGSEVLVTDT